MQISALDVAIVGEERVRYAEYVLPSALEGVKIEPGTQGKCKITLGGAHVETKNAKELSLVLDVIFEQGSARFVGEGVVNNVPCEEYLVFSDVGSSRYFIDRKSKLPKRICIGDVSFDFIWIEIGEL